MKKFLFDILYYSQILRLSKKFYFHYQLKKYIKKDNVVIDIGANWGIYTRLFLRWADTVYAVEPMPEFYRMLKCTEKFNYALGEERKDVKLKHWRNTDGAYKVSDDGEYNVTMVKGSWLFGLIYKLDFIKIDVESFTKDEGELPIIRDMRELILKHKPMILVETGFLDDILELLPGYKVIDFKLDDYLLGCR